MFEIIKRIYIFYLHSKFISDNQITIHPHYKTKYIILNVKVIPIIEIQFHLTSFSFHLLF